MDNKTRMMKITLMYGRWLCGVMLLSLGLIGRAIDSVPPTGGQVIAIEPTEGCNFTVEDVLSPCHAVLSLSSHVHNIFIGVMTNLSTSEETCLGFSMTSNDSATSKADVSKWINLKSIYSYAPFADYDSYVWYRKDADGRWVSSDPFATGASRFAGKGELPTQNVVPAELSKAFLSPDGTYWSTFADIDNCEAVPAGCLYFTNLACMQVTLLNENPDRDNCNWTRILRTPAIKFW